ncbi:MAG: outer membrane beta-barrel protein [Elusimicrobia bacterium]|nr:outer membrane beta-barrel protein [Elusimicrobiota bacterium]
MKLLTTALVIGLFLVSTHANAQVTPGAQQATITLGLANPVSNDSVDDQTETFGELGPAFGFTYLYQLQRYVSIGGDFNYKYLRTKDATTGHGPVEIKSSAWTLLAIARGDLLPDNNLRPYGLLGLGVGGVRRSTEYSTHPSLDSTRTSNGPALALGGGVDYDINATWLAGAELRYNYIHTSDNEIGADSVSTLDFLVKLGYKF